MGKEMIKLCEAGYHGASLAGGIDPRGGDGSFPVFTSATEVEDIAADVIVDFSHHAAVGEITDLAERLNIPIVIATTGHTEADPEPGFTIILICTLVAP